MLPITPEAREGMDPVVFAKDQPQYLPLPANVGHNYVETKWKLSWKERLHAFIMGSVYLTLKTYNEPLQPIRLSLLRATSL